MIMKALQWYANENHYNSDGAPFDRVIVDTPSMPYPEEDLVLDKGRIAREAIKEVNNMGYCDYTAKEIELSQQVAVLEDELIRLRHEYEELVASLEEKSKAS